jgi:virginiamycin B lyase
MDACVARCAGRRVVLVAAVFVAATLMAGGAPQALSAAARASTSVPCQSIGPTDVTRGPDGRVWIADGAEVQAVTTAGRVTSYPIGQVFEGLPRAIAAGPDGKVWVGGGSHIAKVAPDGATTLFTLSAQSAVRDLAAGADGAVWFVDQGLGAVGRITPSGAVTDFPVPPSGGHPALQSIVLGPDHNMWFTDLDVPLRPGVMPDFSVVGRVTPSGQISVFQASLASVITPAAAGVLYVATAGGGLDMVTTAGQVVPVTLVGLATPNGATDLTADRLGNLWISDPTSIDVTEITAVGPLAVVTGTRRLPSPAFQFPVALTIGADGRLWATEPSSVAAFGTLIPGAAEYPIVCA